MRLSRCLFALFMSCALLAGAFLAGGAVDPEDLLDWTTGGKLERLAKHIGTIDYRAWQDEIMPVVRQLQSENQVAGS